ncbi:MAG: methyl-accepting chemotaxis protein [Candidatus Kapaibacterium sp.]|jgi:methyl-accepting chemotaxis protein
MFKNIKISFKLILTTVVFVIPISVLFYYVMLSFDKDIGKAQSEIKGNNALSELVEMTNDVIEYHNLHILKGVDYPVYEKYYGDQYLLKLADSIEKSSEGVISSMSIYKNKINLLANYDTDSSFLKPIELKELWNNILKNPDIEYFNEFYSASLKLTRFIADESGLIADPDLDSYYLMDISALVLPKMQIDIGNIIAIIQNSYSTGFVTDFEISKVRLLSEIIELDYLERINQAINTSIREDKNYYGEKPGLKGNLAGSFDEFNNNILEFTKSVRLWYSGSGNNEAEIFKNVKILSNSALNSSIYFRKSVHQELDSLLNIRINHYKNLRLVSILSSGAAFALAVMLVLIVSKQISKHLGIVTSIAVEIAEGNIDKAVSAISSESNLGVFKHYTDDNMKIKDEIITMFRAVRKMTFNLSSLLNQVSKSANQVSDTTFKITSSAHDIEATVAEQAALTNQVNATSNEISQTASALAQTMDYLTQSFHDNASLLMTGLNNLNEIKLSINELFESTSDISQKLELIKERASGINSVITTITKVANQTNLVSLNASIEAERAGAFGTGFAVVAREIRRLADQTAVAALNIEAMITDMQVAVAEGDATIAGYMDKSRASTEKTAEIIDRISVLIDRTNELPEKIFDVNMGMKQQSESAVQIHESMQQLNTAAIQTRNTIIEFNNATEKLSDAVKGLTDELQNFSLKSIS